MKENALYHGNDSWDLSKLPDYIACASMISNDPNHLCSINTTGSVKLNGYITSAILDFCKGRNSNICIVKIGKGCYASEWKRDDGKYIIAYANSSGELNASIVSVEKKAQKFMAVPEIGNPSDDLNTTSILAMYIQMLCEPDGTDATQEAYDCLSRCAESYSKSFEAPLDDLYKLNDYIQESLNGNKIPINIQHGAIDMLTKPRVANNALKGAVLCGHSDIICPGAAAASSGKKMTITEAKALFQSYADRRKWTPAEEARIRSFPDDYIVPEEVIEIADWFINSRGSKLPANNVCWRGVTGCGKSTGAAILSCILHTPLYIMTCSTTTETRDFLSSLIPATKPSLSVNLPSIEDIWIDPEAAYEQITGIHVDNVTSQQVLEKYGEACVANSSESNYFKRVKSEYIKALESGAIVEIQEFSRIKDSGVLVGLNEYDHEGAVIPLIDDEQVTRHKDAICLWTDNVGYGSCRTVDPSVMRRMNFVIDTFELEKEKVISRALYNTDNILPKETVSAMYEVWKAIRDYCEKEDITDGDLSPCDLENWISRVGHVGLSNVNDIARKCLVSKVTTDRETQERITTTVLSVAIDKNLGTLMQ